MTAVDGKIVCWILAFWWKWGLTLGLQRSWSLYGRTCFTISWIIWGVFQKCRHFLNSTCFPDSSIYHLVWDGVRNVDRGIKHRKVSTSPMLYLIYSISEHCLKNCFPAFPRLSGNRR
jgi:hypothetical protein